MTDIEMALVCFINEYHRRLIYRNEKYQMLHGIEYQKQMSSEHIGEIRNKYASNCFEAAYELKTYYAENGILSNTIVLKMRPESPDIQGFTTIKVYSDIENKMKEYTHHAVEIFKEYGRYKVFDILHSDKTVWLETYLDELCKANNSERDRLRYDLGYLAPCHAFSGNMQELSDLMSYLDKVYCIGKPRVTLMNPGKKSLSDISVNQTEGMLLSDDMAMDFDEFERKYGLYDVDSILTTYQSVYDRLMGVRFNMLHMLCLGHIMRDPIMKTSIAESIFDDARICRLMENAPATYGNGGGVHV